MTCILKASLPSLQATPHPNNSDPAQATTSPCKLLQQGCHSPFSSATKLEHAPTDYYRQATYGNFGVQRNPRTQNVRSKADDGRLRAQPPFVSGKFLARGIAARDRSSSTPVPFQRSPGPEVYAASAGSSPCPRELARDGIPVGRRPHVQKAERQLRTFAAPDPQTPDSPTRALMDQTNRPIKYPSRALRWRLRLFQQHLSPLPAFSDASRLQTNKFLGQRSVFSPLSARP